MDKEKDKHTEEEKPVKMIIMSLRIGSEVSPQEAERALRELLYGDDRHVGSPPGYVKDIPPLEGSGR
jgi:hypothetical protein